MRTLSASTLLIVVSISAHGQFVDKEPAILSFGLSLSVKYHHIDVSKLNDFLRSNDLKDVKSGYGNIGAGINYKFNRHFFEVAGDVDINETTAYNDSDIGTSSYGYSMNINYGYELKLYDQFKIMPYLGISRTTFKTKISDKAGPNFEFQNVTTDRNSISLDNDTFSVNPGAKIWMPLGDGDFSYIVLDVGYGFKTSSKWTIDDATVDNAPEINPSGMKIGVTFLFMMCR
ncbi:outer membrane beta-barrel protein [Chryseolinea sp. T2]|uniref:outer membrane beta-barrel protein n=1 Tax=Chryseolinea sp. T2 TaxID=3129255 RepID=UPI0030770A4D